MVTVVLETCPLEGLFSNHHDISKVFSRTRCSFLQCLGIVTWEAQVFRGGEGIPFIALSLLLQGSCLVSILLLWSRTTLSTCRKDLVPILKDRSWFILYFPCPAPRSAIYLRVPGSYQWIRIFRKCLGVIIGQFKRVNFILELLCMINLTFALLAHFPM